MNLRLPAKKSPAHGVRRLARRELGKAAGALTRLRQRGESVHIARKHVKKARALLRLVQRRIGPGFFRSENKALRELGRKLSAVRDAQVVLAALNDLRHTTSHGQTARALNILHETLTQSSPEAASPDVSTKEARARACEFQRRRRQAERWPLKKLSHSDLTSALSRSYRRSHRALTRYETKRTLQNLHDWRKRTKDFWYQMLMLEALIPRDVLDLAPQVESLTEAQGMAHDLDLLQTALDERRPTMRASDYEVIRKLIHKRLHVLEAQILKAGHDVFSKPPESFAARLTS